MTKKLVHIGKEYGIVIEKLILDQSGIAVDAEFEFVIKGKDITLRHVDSEHKKAVHGATERAIRTHHEVLKRLA